MTVKNITDYLELLAPLSQAEDFDNVGLLIGDAQTTLTGVLVSLDTTEAIIDEAITKNCNLIISFHPLIFSGLKKINQTNFVERVVTKAIKNNMAIYSMHTALDNIFNGVSGKMADLLGLDAKKVLIPKQHTIKKLTTYVPHAFAGKLRRALFKVGAGAIGNYNRCSFNLQGQGTYKGTDASNPTIGKKGEFHIEPETLISVTFQSHLESKLIEALFKVHPYEEVAYEIITLNNHNQHIGLGIIGTLANPLTEKGFLKLLKKTFNVPCLRHSNLLYKKIKKVALLGGSGSFAIEAAKKAKADVYVTADLKYHDFFKAENQLVMIDIGHYESEQFTKNLIVDYLTKKFSNFAIVLSEINTNPINYI